jgi:hypothetical protein
MTPARINWTSGAADHLLRGRVACADRHSKFDMSVSITPGATAFTRMPRGPNAAAKYLTRVLMAPLLLA